MIIKESRNPRLPLRTVSARILLVICSALALWLLATVPLKWDEQAVLGGLLLAIGIVVSKFSPSHGVTLALCVLSAFSTVRYAYWRLSETYSYLSVNWSEARIVDLVFVFALLAAELYAFLILFLGFFQTAKPLNRPPVPLPDDVTQWPSVDVYIPTYNEPLEVVRATVLASLSIDWPAELLNVYVLDDGRRSEFREFAESCGAGYMVRPDNKHAKAGNINHALRQTTGDYVAIFDCDHIPTRSFLQVAMGWFLKDPKLAMLQTPHHFYSPDPFERNLGIFRQVPNEGALFYGIIQDGSDFWNGTFFCGSCAVLRRPAIEQIGGIAVETVTEDAHTSLRMQRLGYNTAYIRFPQAAGLATGSLGAHIGQRIRWARGMIQILRLDNPLLGKGLKLPQRLCYLNSMLHFLYAGPRLIFLTSPLVYLLFGCSNIYGYGRAILAYALPHLAFAILTNSRVQGKYRYSFWNEVYEAVLAPYILLPTTVALISPKHGKFNVTSKGDTVEETFFDWGLAAPYVVLLLLNLAAVVSGIARMIANDGSRETLTINVCWSLLNVMVLGAATAVAREAKQRRSNVRISSSIPLTLVSADGLRLDVRTTDVSRGGIGATLTKHFPVKVGDKIQALFQTAEEEIALPLIVVGNESGQVRCSFGELSLLDEERLVRVLFGRADSWLDWRDSTKGDRPLVSFLHILGISLQGIAIIPVALVEYLRKASSAPQAKAKAKAIASNPALPAMAFAALLLSGMLAVPSLGRAQTTDSPSFSDSYDLSALGVKQAVVLKGAESRTAFSFGVPLTKVVTQLSLSLNYRASIALAAKASLINISLNNSPVASVPVTQPDTPESVTSAEVELPAELLTTDNTLTVELQGKCAPGCNGGTPSDLWLRFEPSTHLRMSGSLLVLTNNLQLLPSPFFDRSSQRKVVANVAFTESPDLHILEAAGVVSSWLGTLADYRGIHFPVTVGEIPTGNVIVFGSRASALLAGLGLGSLSGPAIALRQNPVDPYGKVLIVTGGNGQEILAAAQALALGRYPKDGDSAELSGFKRPPVRRAYDAPRWLSPSASTLLGGPLGPEDLRVYGNGSVNLYFRLPPDLYVGSKAYLPIQLGFQLAKWSPEMSGVMHVKLNGFEIASRTVRDNSSHGPQFAKIGLPIDHLTPSNTLTVEFSLDSSRELGPHEYPEENILKASSVDLAGMPHFVEMPRLDLFENSGFPFTKFADLSDTAVIISDNASAQQLSLYLSALGFLGAQTGYPAIHMTVLHPSEASDASDKDLIVFNSPQSASSSPSPVMSQTGFEQGATVLSSVHNNWIDLPWSQQTKEKRRAEQFLSVDPQPAGSISESASPLNRRRTAVRIDVSDPSKLSAMESVFGGKRSVARVYGSISFLQAGQFHSFVLKSKAYSIGELRWDERVRLWLENHYSTMPFLLVIVALVLAIRMNLWLDERAKLRLRAEV